MLTIDLNGFTDDKLTRDVNILSLLSTLFLSIKFKKSGRHNQLKFFKLLRPEDLRARLKRRHDLFSISAAQFWDRLPASIKESSPVLANKFKMGGNLITLSPNFLCTSRVHCSSLLNVLHIKCLCIYVFKQLNTMESIS